MQTGQKMFMCDRELWEMVKRCDDTVDFSEKKMEKVETWTTAVKNIYHRAPLNRQFVVLLLHALRWLFAFIYPFQSVRSFIHSFIRLAVRLFVCTAVRTLVTNHCCTRSACLNVYSFSIFIRPHANKLKFSTQCGIIWEIRVNLLISSRVFSLQN